MFPKQRKILRIDAVRTKVPLIKKIIKNRRSDSNSYLRLYRAHERPKRVKKIFPQFVNIISLRLKN